MRLPTKGGKLNIVDMIDMVVELEGKWMDLDVSTITSLPDDDNLLMIEDTKEASFQYDDNPTQGDLMYSKPHNNLESILDPEDALDGKMATKPQADRVGISEQYQQDSNEVTSQLSDEVEWDDKILEEQIQDTPIKDSVKTSDHLARYETTTQVAQSKQHQTCSEEEVTAMLRKDNRTNINQMKAQQQQAARKKLQMEKQARSNKSRKADQSSTDSDNELIAASTATIHQSNIRSGDNTTNSTQTIQQATEGVALPVFHNTLPRKYLY